MMTKKEFVIVLAFVLFVVASVIVGIGRECRTNNPPTEEEIYTPWKNEDIEGPEFDSWVLDEEGNLIKRIHDGKGAIYVWH